jgi:hypothetical protein
VDEQAITRVDRHLVIEVGPKPAKEALGRHGSEPELAVPRDFPCMALGEIVRGLCPHLVPDVRGRRLGYARLAGQGRREARE